MRLLEPHHASALFALTDKNREYLRKWLPWIDYTQSEDDSAAFISISEQQHNDQEGFHAGIWHDRNLVGCIGFHRIDWAHRQVKIGYWLAQGHQGHGLVTAATRAMTQHALVDLGLNRVEIRAATSNLKSRAIPERLGFKFEGVARQAEWLYDHFVDLAVYAILASEWR